MPSKQTKEAGLPGGHHEGRVPHGDGSGGQLLPPAPSSQGRHLLRQAQAAGGSPAGAGESAHKCRTHVCVYEEERRPGQSAPPDPWKPAVPSQLVHLPPGAKALRRAGKWGDVEKMLGRETGDQHKVLQLHPAFLTQFWGWAQGEFQQITSLSRYIKYIYIWLHWVSVAAPGIPSCLMWDPASQPGVEPRAPV